ncbi:hypothetical protein GVN21_03265 [Caulobacter sp. SLTY]|uniref:hypothetical protein n=1 Tax=Caulobacter sp. SLTY TaxID=2683262 RepID=UPI001412FA85|nr:hypothetical protein [Caulobacter sp. SLTY]NBB14375.1 hypothetical protein [Caulobacter sp. SLTY]
MRRFIPALTIALLASPAAAHEGHGAEGLLHGFSDEHGVALLGVAIVLGLVAAFHKPLARIVARLRKRP